MKYLLSTLLCLCAIIATAQDLKYEMSGPIDVNTAGWDKVLLMPNGNTVLFHFELRKGIIVKVFDKARKEIASKKHICEVLDISVLDRQRAYFKALEAINGEAVLFISQYIDNRETLVRLRVDATTGDLIEEVKLVQSPTYKDLTETHVYKQGDKYYVICNTIVRGYSESNLLIKIFDEKHNVTSEIPWNINYKDYQSIRLRFLKFFPDRGILFGFQSFTNDSRDALAPSLLTLVYYTQQSNQFISQKVQLPGNYGFQEANVSYNTFAQKFNIILTSMGEFDIYNNKQFQYPYQSILIASEDLTAIDFKPLTNHKMNKQIVEQVDSLQMFVGYVDTVITNSFGQSTIVYSSAYFKKQNLGMITKGLLFKYGISITQLNDNGEETWATMVPHVYSYTTSLHL